MPNHVSSRLTLTGDPATVREFYEAHIRSCDNHSDRLLDFNTLIPMPAALNCPAVHGDLSDLEGFQQANYQRYGYTDWYEWRVDHWGH